jgi:uncharacterized membrane protein YhaH (DUF805 family)
MSWYLTVLKKYAVFAGRARRKEYWMFVLFNAIFSFALGFIEGIVGLFPEYDFAVLSIIYGLAVLVPGLAVSIRRLHDTGRTGWWLFIVMIPFVGGIILIAFTAQDSQPGDNEYGPNPKVNSMSPTQEPARTS